MTIWRLGKQRSVTRRKCTAIRRSYKALWITCVLCLKCSTIALCFVVMIKEYCVVIVGFHCDLLLFCVVFHYVLQKISYHSL